MLEDLLAMLTFASMRCSLKHFSKAADSALRRLWEALRPEQIMMLMPICIRKPSKIFRIYLVLNAIFGAPHRSQIPSHLW